MRRIPIVRLLRTVGILEGLSFLVLLFIAMPLKYGWGYACAVRVPGLVHGASSWHSSTFCMSLRTSGAGPDGDRCCYLVPPSVPSVS